MATQDDVAWHEAAHATTMAWLGLPIVYTTCDRDTATNQAGHTLPGFTDEEIERLSQAPDSQGNMDLAVSIAMSGLYDPAGWDGRGCSSDRARLARLAPDPEFQLSWMFRVMHRCEGFDRKQGFKFAVAAVQRALVAKDVLTGDEVVRIVEATRTGVQI